MSVNHDKNFNKENKTVLQFENYIKNKTPFFFDIDEFEEIIEHYLITNKLTKASEAVKIASKFYPLSTEIIIYKAKLLIEDNQLANAISELNNAKKYSPENFELYLLIGISLLKLKNFHEAIKNFEKCINLLPRNVYKDEIYLTIGFYLNKAHKNSTALKYLFKAEEINDKNIDVKLEIAYCYESLVNYGKSIEYFNKAIEIDPFSISSWYSLGLAYYKVKNIEKAIESLDYALAIEPDFLSALITKAQIFFNENKFLEAKNVFLEYLNYDKEYIEIYYYLAICYEKLEDYDNALRNFKVTIKYDPENSDAWLGIGIIYMHENNYSKSLHYLRKAYKIYDFNSGVLYSLAELYLKKNNITKAFHYAEKAVRVADYEVDNHLLLSEIYELKNDIKKAILVLKNGYYSAISKAPILYRLAGLYLKINEKRSLKYLKLAIKIDSSLLQSFINIYPQVKNCEIFEGLLNLHQNKTKNEL